MLLDSPQTAFCIASLADSPNRPTGVLGNKRFRIDGCTFQRRQIVQIAYVPQRYANVSQKSAALDSLDRRIAKHYPKLRVAEGEIIAQRHADCRFSCGECAFARDLRESVPGTCIQAFIATVDAISDERTKIDRNGAFQLDCQIRNATTRIQSMRTRDRARRTSSHATLTFPTAIALRII